MNSLSPYTIRAVERRDRAWVMDMIISYWGDDHIVIHGDIIYPHRLPGFIFWTHDGEAIGLVTYQIRGPDCEIITLNSLNENQGVGSKLVDAVREEGMKSGCSRLCLTTTNDNQRAIAFYKRRGFYLKNIHIGAVDKNRRLKPSIPNISAEGISIEDEWEFELILSA